MSNKTVAYGSEYIAQRTPWDCGICSLAMACGPSYEAVFADLGEAAAKHEGINDDQIDRWLCAHDWAWQTVARNRWTGEKFEPVSPWPPSPFAPVHICFVEATIARHYCVMTFEGRVLDPFNPERQTLSHPDYKRVGTVRGLYKIRYTEAVIPRERDKRLSKADQHKERNE
jgi:hypothetical protein